MSNALPGLRLVANRATVEQARQPMKRQLWQTALLVGELLAAGVPA
jgi:hypothetical protein